ncbi:MAG: Gmad2 immunoglobulin-like domain-containing protein [Flavobacteriales bacterium]|jgi:hypothetical protein|uniref:Gmad2 immunoglobulin-like domain-containing protein n=1 Tax=Candidatus Ulvibacter alkanivorans TaxID=2267620 RepID=UPI000DF48A94|nr:Gmad2 immunoglobulin-like domain-containing protein [Candidatus Ulvibacter alkanivorans]MCH2489638.1 Gmad2 immunoglobulin-like domain-containing protein [Flavobacteriales bacterium]
MKKLPILSLFFALLLLGCNEKKQSEDPVSNTDPTEEKDTETPTKTETYRNDTWHFALDYPPSFTVLESELPGDAPVINVYKKNTTHNPPFAFHEEPDLFYLSFIPNGFGTETPNGEQQSFQEWSGSLPLDFEVDQEASTVFLLENGEPWAYMLKFNQPPKDWGNYATIFIHLPIEGFSAECINASGNTKPMAQCDPLGSDTVNYKGSINANDRNILNTMLRSLRFYTGEEKEKQLSELIQIEHPLPNLDVTSPLTIKGKARGYWYFEGSFPYKLEDANGAELASGSINADGKWMTEEFVPFEKQIAFEAPDDERGYLVFKRANASGKPEHDRTYRLPVLFPPK